MYTKSEFGKSGNLAVIQIGGENYFSTAETARRLGVCQGTFYASKKRFGFDGVRVGKRKYYAEKDLAKCVFNRTFEVK